MYLGPGQAPRCALRQGRGAPPTQARVIVHARAVCFVCLFSPPRPHFSRRAGVRPQMMPGAIVYFGARPRCDTPFSRDPGPRALRWQRWWCGVWGCGPAGRRARRRRTGGRGEEGVVSPRRSERRGHTLKRHDYWVVPIPLGGYKYDGVPKGTGPSSIWTT